MRLLLDTHVWLWSLLEPEKLSTRVRHVLRQPDTDLWLSPISVWEALLLADRGRLILLPDPQAWIESALAALPIQEATLTHDIARESRRIALPHPDPADRFLAATARVLDLTLVTSDARLLACPGIQVLAA